MNTKTTPENRLYYIIPPIILVMMAALWYSFSVSYEFQFDDLANIVNNFQVRTSSIWELFLANTRWISQSLNTLYYQLGKFNPFIYRLANITAHIITGIVVYFVACLALRRLKHETFFYKQRFSIAFLTAGLFLLHPVQTQTVSYIIQGQLEGLASLATAAMIMFFLIYVTAHNFWAQLLALGCMYSCMLLAPGTKEIAIISPILVLLIDWFFVAQGNIYSLKKRWWLHLSLFIGIFGMYIYFLKPDYFTTILGLKMELHNNMGNSLTDTIGAKITPFWYCISQFKVILHYIWIFFWPFTMSVDYDWVLVKNFFSFDCIVPLILLLALAAYTLYRLYHHKADLVSFGILWFFLAVLPRSSIIPSTELVADYKTYLASVGLFFLCASAFTYLLVWLEQHMLFLRTWYVHWALMLLFLLPIGHALYQRNKVWRTAQEFWLNILQNAPGKARAYNNYGVALCSAHKSREAIPYFQKAISMDKVYSDPHNNLAVAYGSIGQLDDAIKALEQSVKICPVQPEAYNNMASFYLEKKDFAKAEELLKIALRLRPHYGKAHFNLGRVYQAQDRQEDAFNCYKTACLKADFDTIDSFAFYAHASMGLKKYDDALLAYKKMLELMPGKKEIISMIINAYIMKNEHEKALPYFQQLLHMHPHEIELIFKYGEALLVCKRYQQALDMFTQVKQINPGFVPGHMRAAVCLYKLDKKKEAFTLLNNFLAQRPPEDFAAPVRELIKLMQEGKI